MFRTWCVRLTKPSFWKKSKMGFISWLGTLTSIIGSFLVAFQIFVLGYCFFIIGSISWLMVAMIRRDKSLAILNLFFLSANTIGIWGAIWKSGVCFLMGWWYLTIKTGRIWNEICTIWERIWALNVRFWNLNKWHSEHTKMFEQWVVDYFVDTGIDLSVDELLHSTCWDDYSPGFGRFPLLILEIL